MVLHHIHKRNFEITIKANNEISIQSIETLDESLDTKLPTASVIISREEQAVIHEKTITLSGSNLSCYYHYEY